MTCKGVQVPPEEDLEPLSRIIAELNKRFGIDLGDDGQATLGQVIQKVEGDAALDAAATRDNVGSFQAQGQSTATGSGGLQLRSLQRFTHEPEFGDMLQGHLFDLYVRGHRCAGELVK